MPEPTDIAAPVFAPAVSVLMPMRDAGEYLQAAVDSILLQDHGNLELIIIDDGSRDGSRERVHAMSDPRVRLVDGPRAGISACLNAGLARACGAIVMRCDADDLFPPGRVRRQWEWLQRHADFVAVCGAFSMIGPNGASIASPLREFDQEALDAAERILDGRLKTHLCAFAVRREAVERLGGFRSWFETAEDIDFALRLAEQGPVGFDPFDAYRYRLHGSSITHTQASVRRRFFEDQARAMSRERLATGADALMRGHPPAMPPPDSARASRPDSARLHIAQMLVGQSWQAFSGGRKRSAIAAAARAIAASPMHGAAWKALLLVTLRPTPR